MPKFRLSLLAFPLLLSACSAGNEFVDEMVEDTSCAFLGCVDSATLAPSEISPNYVVTQENGFVRVHANLGKGREFLTQVRPSNGDHLSLSSGGLSSNLSDTDGLRMRYVGELREASEQPQVSVNFIRGSEVHASSVTLPKPLSVLSPASPSNLGRSTGTLWVRLQHDASLIPGLSVDLNCSRSDGSSFSGNTLVNSKLDAAAPGGAAMAVSTFDLDQALNLYGQGLDPKNPNKSLVQRCELDFIWLVSVSGQVAPTLSKFGGIRAERRAKHQISYDARL
ncbi:hypothetical protein DBR47_11485 [Paucibacter sp. KBW04]|uniref:hypothetical protein n=1 Tax=Paucibacter sp. KBW04 TaxID=2153361 RepID=UPI000F55E133|nr:hypothetical protein [Paucibacter sp. KBW04]RQO59971.1 hypothetical protein DBR47_11485 [Paucibacter sp. KBW04]